MQKLRFLYVLPTMLLFSGLNCNCDSQVANNSTEKERLSFVAKIDLPNVSGRIDHIAYDSSTHLAFIACLGNNTVEIVNIETKQTVHSIKQLHEPQGITYVPSLKRLVVANGDNGDCIFFDATTFEQIGAVPLKDDADNIRYDPESQLLYVGYGDGGIAIIDPVAMKKTGDIDLDGHPESFQLSKKHRRIFANVPDADEIEVADLSTNKLLAKWKNKEASANFPMAIDENNNRLFIACRNPPKLKMSGIESGKDIKVVGCSGDADDVFYYTPDSLIFLSAGKGFIDVFRTGQRDLIQINHIESRPGARTSLLLASVKKFLLAVPARGGRPAALWVYNLNVK